MARYSPTGDQRQRDGLGKQHPNSHLDSILDARIQYLRADIRRAVEARIGPRSVGSGWRFGGHERRFVCEPTGLEWEEELDGSGDAR